MQPQTAFGVRDAFENRGWIEIGCVGGKDGLRSHRPIQLGENGAFGVHVLEHRLDGEIVVLCRTVVIAASEVAQSRIPLLLRHFAALHGAIEIARHPVPRTVGRVVVLLDDRNRQARIQHRSRNPRSHQSASDDDHFIDRSRRAVADRCRFGNGALCEESMAQGPAFRRIPQFHMERPLLRQTLAGGQPRPCQRVQHMKRRLRTWLFAELLTTLYRAGKGRRR